MTSYKHLAARLRDEGNAENRRRKVAMTYHNACHEGADAIEHLLKTLAMTAESRARWKREALVLYFVAVVFFSLFLISVLGR